MLEEEYQSNNESINNQTREYVKRSEGLHTCNVLFCLILEVEEPQIEVPQLAALLLFWARKVEWNPK